MQNFLMHRFRLDNCIFLLQFSSGVHECQKLPKRLSILDRVNGAVNRVQFLLNLKHSVACGVPSLDSCFAVLVCRPCSAHCNHFPTLSSSS